MSRCKATISDPVKATETRFKIMDRIQELEGIAGKCKCGEPLKNGTIKSYNHSDGVEAAGYEGSQWFYIHCEKCNYDYALWKLHVKLDDLGEKVDSENVLPAMP